MAESNVSLLFQNSGTIYVINEETQLGFRLFIDRDAGTIRRPEGNYLIYGVTEEGELGERVQDVREASKSFDELREDGWELPWEDDSVVSFTQDEDNSIVINNGGDVSTFPDPLEDPITPTPEPVPTPEEPIPVNDSESIERTANLTGSFDLQFWGETHKDLIDEKEYPGGNLSFTENPSFNVNTPVYNSTDAAYEDDYEVPSDDLLISLGTLIYRNDKVDDDFGRSRANHGANFKLTLDEPVDASYSSNFYLDIINRRESYETIKVGFRGPGPNKYKTLQFRSSESGRGLPIFLDYMGAREVGASEDTPLEYSFDVSDDTTAEFELFGRLYTTEELFTPVEITSISEDTDEEDFKTLDNTLVFNGTAEPLSDVTVFLDNNAIGTTATDSAGDWSLDYTSVELADGEYGLTATATNSSGYAGSTNKIQLLEIGETPTLVISFKGFLGSSGSGNDADKLTQNQLDIGNNSGLSPGVGALLKEKFGDDESLIIKNFGPFQVKQASDFINEYPSDYRLVIIGHSFGGDSTIELVNDYLLPNNRQVDLTIQIDSVGTFDEKLPTNVKQGINYWQYVPSSLSSLSDIQGADYVEGAININAENLLGVKYTEITHTNIDELLKNTIIEDVTTIFEGDLITRQPIEGPDIYDYPITPVPAPTPDIDSTSDSFVPSLIPTPAPELLPTPDVFI